MKFGTMQARRFDTGDGAYSIVTEREYYDSQITLTDYEADLVLSYFGKSQIHVGPVKLNPSLALKSFKLFPDGAEVKLNIVYPKPEKQELRLYISVRAGFKPASGSVLFMFVKDGSLWLGQMPENIWRLESSELKLDEYDDVYQREVDEHGIIKTTRHKERDSFSRDRKVALERLKLSRYSCEFDSKHNLFLSRFSRKPYLEVHHLIPISLQGEFPKPLDTIHNVFCLCPYCHRAVHHAEESVARDILSKLAETRPVLDDYSLSVPELFNLYAVESIC